MRERDHTLTRGDVVSQVTFTIKVVIKLSIFTPCFELKSCVKMGVTLASETTFPFSIMILRLPLHIVIFFFKLPSLKLMSNEVDMKMKILYV